MFKTEVIEEEEEDVEMYCPNFSGRIIHIFRYSPSKIFRYIISNFVMANQNRFRFHFHDYYYHYLFCLSHVVRVVLFVKIKN